MLEAVTCPIHGYWKPGLETLTPFQVTAAFFTRGQEAPRVLCLLPPDSIFPFQRVNSASLNFRLMILHPLHSLFKAFLVIPVPPHIGEMDGKPEHASYSELLCVAKL